MFILELKRFNKKKSPICPFPKDRNKPYNNVFTDSPAELIRLNVQHFAAKFNADSTTETVPVTEKDSIASL